MDSDLRSGAGGRFSRPAALATALCLSLGSATAEAAPQTHTIVIEGMRFLPATLTMHRGDRVVWRNRDIVPHTATADRAFDSHSIAADGTWTYVAHRTGTLPYRCAFHPTMAGLLRVQ